MLQVVLYKHKRLNKILRRFGGSQTCHISYKVGNRIL